MLFVILGVLGAVCLFLYGMRVVGDALQKMSGKRMRVAVRKLTHTKGRGFISGFVLTSLIQTSSAATLLIVSFVNAGVVSLRASLPMIIGSNLGTTVKLWFIAFLGFQFDIANYSLILIALGFPFLFFRKGNLKNTGEFLIGFALLFLGLYFMKSVFPEADEHSVFYEWVQNASRSGLSGILLFVLLGFVITAIIQSSSAAITLTFVLCYHGVIGFPMAVAMLLGQNIGTTVTVNIGALVANTIAKRAALSHLLMNVFTVIVVLPFFSFFIRISEKMLLTTFSADMNDPYLIPLGLTFAHTMFNLILAVFMLPFINPLIKITEIILPVRNKKRRLRVIEDKLFSTSEMSLLQARTVLIRFAVQVRKMMQRLPLLLYEKKDEKLIRYFDEIRQSEQTAKRRHHEITDYLSAISQKDISMDGSRMIVQLSEISVNINALSGLVLQFAKVIERKNESGAWFSQQMRETLTECMQLLNDAGEKMIDILSDDISSADMEEALLKHEHLILILNQLKSENIAQKKQSEIPADSRLYFNQLLILIEQMSDIITRNEEILAR
jgi:phosphate:Na+ symporter